MSPALNKVQRLAIAAATATALRSAKRRRPIKLVDAEGRVVGTIDSLTLAEKLHARAGIELDVIDEARPTHSQCQCGRWFEQPKKGPRLSICGPCRRHPCSAKLKSGAPCRALATETSSTRARLGRARAYCRRQRGPGEGDDDDEDGELPWPPDPPPAAVQVRGRRTAGMISLASQLLNRPQSEVGALTSRGAAPASSGVGADGIEGARSTTFAPNMAACRALSRSARATAEACDGVNEACEAPKCAHPADEPLKLVGSRPKPTKAPPGTSLPNTFFMRPIYPATMS